MKVIKILDIIMSILFLCIIFEIDMVFSYDFLEYMERICYLYVPISLITRAILQH